MNASEIRQKYLSLEVVLKIFGIKIFDYYSDYIPYERELKNKLNNNTISKEDAALPNINASDLVTKDDIVEILGMLFDFINLSNDENDESNNWRTSELILNRGIFSILFILN